jgi:hypothetical protein
MWPTKKGSLHSALRAPVGMTEEWVQIAPVSFRTLQAGQRFIASAV